MSGDDAIAADIAVIGGGVAGLSLALTAAERERVAVFCKRPLGRSASAWAQGGVAAVFGEDDSFECHLADTLAAGDGLCDEEAARTVIEEGPAAIRWLARQGAAFNAGDGGEFSLALEGGHRRRRIAHVDDRSGEAIVSALSARARAHPNIVLHERHIAIDLFVGDGACRGFYALDLRRRRVVAVSAGAVALATGGAGRAYLYSSTPDDATGDGIGMALRAGCRVANMEFFQFHPTCLFHPQTPTLLISEAARGEGGRLVNGDGVAFAAATHADGDLAPRDVVARAIDAEMKKSGADCAYLDFSAHGRAFWERRFPTIVSRCDGLGLRIPDDRLPVVPAAHYGCGGVVADLRGRTDLPGLFAVGETADIGLHGANRLASNSLLECAVMGRRCGEAIRPAGGAAISAWDERRISPAAETVMISHNWEELRRIMWNYVGIARSDERLRRARRRVEVIRDEINEYYRRHVVNRDFLELRNLAQCAELIIEGAMGRRESRGLHYNADCPDKAAAAAATSLSRGDFEKRRAAINGRCPFSGRDIVAGGWADYRGAVVGFCNGGCRDSFAAAAAGGFAGADAAILAARDQFDAIIAGGEPCLG